MRCTTQEYVSHSLLGQVIAEYTADRFDCSYRKTVTKKDVERGSDKWTEGQSPCSLYTPPPLKTDI